MKIETKFKVGDLIKRIYDSQADDKEIILQIMEIITQTCYAGTQVLYDCKYIHLSKRFKERFEQKGEYWVIGHGMGNADRALGWARFREDEVCEISKEVRNIITSK
jgi:hypothetical protein